MVYLETSKNPPVHGNGKSQFLVPRGNIFNCFFHCHVSFRGCTNLLVVMAILGEASDFFQHFDKTASRGIESVGGRW